MVAQRMSSFVVVDLSAQPVLTDDVNASVLSLRATQFIHIVHL